MSMKEREFHLWQYDAVMCWWSCYCGAKVTDQMFYARGGQRFDSWAFNTVLDLLCGKQHREPDPEKLGTASKPTVIA
jgi:hypothetical protein